MASAKRALRSVDERQSAGEGSWWAYKSEKDAPGLR